MTGTIVLTLHIIVAFVLILVVLLQTGKGANIGAAFGGSSQTVFGSRGPAGFMSKLTTAAAIIFMLTSLTLSILASRGGKTTIIDDITPPAAQESRPSDTIDPFEPEAQPADNSGAGVQETGEQSGQQ